MIQISFTNLNMNQSNISSQYRMASKQSTIYNPQEQSTFSAQYNASIQPSYMQKSSLMAFGKGDEERVTKELEK